MPGERKPNAVSLGLDAAKQVEEYIKAIEPALRNWNILST